MSARDKMIDKLLSRPRDFTFDEAEGLFGKLGYVRDNGGITSGSRVAFINTETKHVIRIHKPHPGKELKLYVVDLIIKCLRENGDI